MWPNGTSPSNRIAKPSQTQRIYNLLNELGRELADFIPSSGCNPAFAAAIMAVRQSVKALKAFF